MALHSASGALRLAEALRSGVEQMRLEPNCNGRPLGITISIGLYTARPDRLITPLEAIGMADQALYRAKQNGRNRIEVADAGAEPPTEPAVVPQ